MGGWGCPKCMTFWFIVAGVSIAMLLIHWYHVMNPA